VKLSLNEFSKLTLVFALTAALGRAQAVPQQTGTPGYLFSNGTTLTWGNISTGASGALDCVSQPGVCDIVTAVVPLKGLANLWTGANDFSNGSFLRLPTGSGVPSAGCGVPTDSGKVYVRNDAKAPNASVYICDQNAPGAYSWELLQTASVNAAPANRVDANAALPSASGANYQPPLTFTGTGPKTASSIGNSTPGDCAQWDANGNVVDSGAPCNTPASPAVPVQASGGGGSTLGGMPVYSSKGAAVRGHIVTGRSTFGGYYHATITFSGQAAFTSATSYVCTGSDISAAVSPIGVEQKSGSEVTFYSASGKGANPFSYICVGN
jgi:hypothetical protein